MDRKLKERQIAEDMKHFENENQLYYSEIEA